jgi:HSP20 family protein
MSDTTTNLEKRTSTADEPERLRSGQTFVPAVDIIERRDELLLLADVPGVKAEDLDINYERGELTLTARVAPRQNAQTTCLLNEYGVGDFVRTFHVGEGIDAAKIQAEVSAGVLTLRLPKSEATRTRKIAVKAT